jgi:hypothetical protein
MIPKFINIGSTWEVLPPGIHDTTLEEIKQRFAITKRRIELYKGFERGVISLKGAGCKVVFLDGSFISQKPIPGDFDALWDTTGVDIDKIDPVLLDFTRRRERQKLKYEGESFPSSSLADGSRTFEEYFQVDKETGYSKGIIRVWLS